MRCNSTVSSRRASPYSSDGGAHGFGHAVAERNQQVTRLQLHRRFLERGVLEEAEDEPALLEPLDRVGTEQERRIVSGVAIGQCAGRFEHAVKRRGEARFDRAPDQRLVDPGQRRAGPLPDEACDANTPWSTAVSSAAGAPLPATSPTAKPKSPFGKST